MDANKLAPPTIEERLAKLEEQNRRLKIAAAVALALIGVVALIGATAPKPKTIEAQMFVVVDKEGNKRAEFGMVPYFATTSGLGLYDENQNRRIVLSVQKADTGLWLYDAKGGRRVTLSENKDLAELTLSDRNGKRRAEVTAGTNGGYLKLRNKDKGRVTVTAYEQITDIEWADQEGHLVGGETMVEPRQLVEIRDESGKVIWQAPPPDDAPDDAEKAEPAEQ